MDRRNNDIHFSDHDSISQIEMMTINSVESV